MLRVIGPDLTIFTFTVRKLAKPPHLIMRIMDCVILLFQQKIDPIVVDPERPCVKPSWGHALKLMSGSGFLAGLLGFPKVSFDKSAARIIGDQKLARWKE